MKYLLVIVLIVTVATAVPNCQLLSGSTDDVFSLVGQTQVLSLNNYFKGYNLVYSQSATATTQLIPPLNTLGTRPINPPLPATLSIRNVDIDASQHAVLLATDLESTTAVIKFGVVTQRNILFSSTKTITHEKPTMCYSAISLGLNQAIVNCQVIGTTQDLFYVIGSDNQITKYWLDSLAETTDRSTLLYTIDNENFLIVSNNQFQTSMIQSYINVYRLTESGQPIYVNTIDAYSFGMSSLMIRDVAIDQKNNIYVADFLGNVVTFKYMKSNEISPIASFSLKQYNPLKIDAIITNKNEVLVFVSLASSVAQINWSDRNAPYISNLYELDTSVDFTHLDLHVSNELVVVQTTSNTNYYRMGDTKLNNLLYSIPPGSLVVLNKAEPFIMTVSHESTSAARISTGYLLVVGNEVSQNIVVTATSGAQVCSLSLKLHPVTDLQQVYAKKSLQVSTLVESSTVYQLSLDQYFLGKQLTYSAVSNQTILNRRHIEPLKLKAADLTTAVWVQTYAWTTNSYYRVSQNNINLLTFELCTSTVELQVNCQQLQSLTYTTIVSAQIFETVWNQKRTAVLAFVTSPMPYALFFLPVEKGPTFIGVLMPNNSTITHFLINPQYMFITLSSTSQILVFNTILNSYKIIDRINASKFTDEQKQTIGRFKPRKVYLSSANGLNPPLLVIRNIDSLVFGVYSATGYVFTAYTKIIADPTTSDSWEVALGSKMMLVVYGKNTRNVIKSYCIKDFYNILFLGNVNINGASVASPVNLVYNPGSKHVFVQTITNGLSNSIHVIKIEAPAISANYYTQMTASVRFVASPINGNTIIQYLSPAAPPKCFYSTASYWISGLNDDQFKKNNLDYLISAATSSNKLDLKGSLTVYNYLNTISSAAKNQVTTLPVSAHNSVIDINLESKFSGPVASYNIDCPYCKQQKIKLSNHIELVSKAANISNARQFAQLDKNILILTKNSVVLATEQLVLISNMPLFDAVDPTIDCHNWVYLNDSNIVAYCVSSTSQFMVSFTTDLKIRSPPIPVANRIDHALKMIIKSDKLFVLDNNVAGTGAGVIQVFSLKQNLPFDQQIDCSTFHISNGQINDFAILTLPDVDKYILLCTLSQSGLGYLSYGYGINPQVLDLTSAQEVSPFLLPNNKWLQVFVFGSTLHPTDVPQDYDLLVTGTNSQQLHCKIQFNSSSGQLTTYQIYNAYNKYGTQQVLNWVTVYAISTSNHLLLIPYYSMNKITLALYQMNTINNVQKPIFFRGSANQPLTNTNSFSAAVLSINGNLKLLMAVDEQCLLFSMNTKTTITGSYDKPSDFKTIDITANNDFSQNTFKQQVAFKTDKGQGLSWQYILVIVLGVLLLGLTGYFMYRFHQKKEQDKKKVSLISEDEEA